MTPPADLRVVEGGGAGGGPHRRERQFLWISMIGGIIFAGAAFAYKIAEFIFTMSSEAARGFADVPITVYFIVAAGWVCILAWCLITGKFVGHEKAKFDMLAQEEEYERLGI